VAQSIGPEFKPQYWKKKKKPSLSKKGSRGEWMIKIRASLELADT
jgi:hypothetical protein